MHLVAPCSKIAKPCLINMKGVIKSQLKSLESAHLVIIFHLLPSERIAPKLIDVKTELLYFLRSSFCRKAGF